MSKYIDEYRDTGLCIKISGEIKRISSKPLNIMEVCGGHTMSIRKNGIQKLIGDKIKLISGPGCPVCVTAIRDVDKIIALSEFENTVICTFGDMMRVPGTKSSLIKAKASGSDIRIVYSAQDAIKLAEEEPGKKIVFIGIGFETTAPTIAAAIREAMEKNLDNFSVLSLARTMPQALEAVTDAKDSRIDALLCPGHVTAITGMSMYEGIVNRSGISCCVSGFEPADLLRAIYLLAEKHEEGKKMLINAYERVVNEEGNVKAKAVMKDVFEPSDVEWRGLGVIPGSGLKIKEEYSRYDADKVFDINVPPAENFSGCICGDILRGAKDPADCGLFGTECTPEAPKGACMVSSEGTCAAWYQYRG